MSKSRPLPQAPLESTTSIESGDPLGLAPKARRNRDKGRPILAIAGGAVVLLAAAVIVRLWVANGRSALAPTVGSVQAEPDPPVNPPPAKELIKPSAGELPIRTSLDARLEGIVRAAADIPDVENRLATNDRVGRWEIRFPTGNTVETYAKQLDALGIELGVIGGEERITYASAFTKDVPETHSGSADNERRFYMTWRSGALRDLDNALLSRAKIQTTGRIVAQFYPPKLETKLTELEKQFAAPRSVNKVRRTVFALVPDDKTFNFRVAEQEYVSGQVKSSDDKAAGAKPAENVPSSAP
ncbi:MAG TPA: hypothetical protein VKB78_12950, partial [Pirellulales bacterium]|nr:hypothetical protein [Pirellulales bacterium]